MRNANKRMLLWSVFTVLAATLPARNAIAGKTPPPIPITDCGTVITAPGSYFLDFDLTCGANASGAGILIVANDVDLDLKGHTLNNVPAYSLNTGVVTGYAAAGLGCVLATGVHIHGGTVSGFLVEGILLCAPGTTSVAMGATVDHMNVTGSLFTGLQLSSSGNNKIENNSFSLNGGIGLNMNASSGNDIGGNAVVGNGAGVGVDAHSANNNLHGNFVGKNSGSNGMYVSSSNNTVQGNFFVANGDKGLEVADLAFGNKISGNTALTNTNADLQDDSGVCVFNTWQNNFFLKSSPGCIQ
jgi:parallel beta-helix repeat protein